MSKSAGAGRIGGVRKHSDMGGSDLRATGFGQLDAVTKIMNVGVLLLNPSFHLEFANELACELLGFDTGAALKGDWPQISPLLHLDDMAGDIVRPRSLKIDFPSSRGLRLLRMEVYALDEDFCSGYLILMRDRSMVHVLEADLLLASQMRAQNYLYGALIHDLRAPLNAMQITVELLSSAGERGGQQTIVQNGKELAPERYIAVLREELARLNRTLRTVLDYGAPLNQERRDFDLLAVIHEIVALLTPQAARQHVDIQLNLPQGPLSINGQRDRIKQALLNVAINGLEALPKSGGFLRIEVQRGEDNVQIVFADSGPGVPEDLLDTIYQVYFTTKEAGSGLGLYVARLVVESHGGEIRVENLPGNGARFCLTLPLFEPLSPP